MTIFRNLCRLRLLLIMITVLGGLGWVGIPTHAAQLETTALDQCRAALLPIEKCYVIQAAEVKISEIVPVTRTGLPINPMLSLTLRVTNDPAAAQYGVVLPEVSQEILEVEFLADLQNQYCNLIIVSLADSNGNPTPYILLKKESKTPSVRAFAYCTENYVLQRTGVYAGHGLLDKPISDNQFKMNDLVGESWKALPNIVQRVQQNQCRATAGEGKKAITLKDYATQLAFFISRLDPANKQATAWNQFYRVAAVQEFIEDYDFIYCLLGQPDPVVLNARFAIRAASETGWIVRLTEPCNAEPLMINHALPLTLVFSPVAADTPENRDAASEGVVSDTYTIQPETVSNLLSMELKPSDNSDVAQGQPVADRTFQVPDFGDYRITRTITGTEYTYRGTTDDDQLRKDKRPPSTCTRVIRVRPPVTLGTATSVPDYDRPFTVNVLGVSATLSAAQVFVIAIGTPLSLLFLFGLFDTLVKAGGLYVLRKLRRPRWLFLLALTLVCFALFGVAQRDNWWSALGSAWAKLNEVPTAIPSDTPTPSVPTVLPPTLDETF